jgi:hypothetical protein
MVKNSTAQGVNVVTMTASRGDQLASAWTLSPYATAGGLTQAQCAAHLERDAELYALS